MRPENEHVPFLDGLRGYAALWVILGHISNLAKFHIPILSSPAAAVDVFMIVSGFLMTQHFFARQQREPWDSPRTWMIFYIRRFFRIAPLYYLALIPGLLWFSYFKSAGSALSRGMWVVKNDPTAQTMNAAMVLTHISFLFGLMPKYSSSLVLPDWSIGLEMQFYAAFPFLMIVARKINPIRLCLIAVPIWMIFVRFTGVYVTNSPGLLGFFPQPSFLPLKLGLFLIGILLAWAWIEDGGTLSPRSALLLVVMLVMCDSADSTGAIAGTAIVTGALISFMLFYKEDTVGLGLGIWITRLRSFLGNRLAGYLARMSYSVYLVHMLILIPAIAILNDIPAFLHQRPSIQFAILLFIVVPATYGTGRILFVLIENPGIQLGKHLVRVFSARWPQQATEPSSLTSIT